MVPPSKLELGGQAVGLHTELAFVLADDGFVHMAELFILGDHKEFGDGGAFSGFRPGLLHAVLFALDPAG